MLRSQRSLCLTSICLTSQSEKVKDTQRQVEVILAEFGCEAMNTFTALEIARGYVVAHPHMFDVIQIGGYIGALAERDCVGTCPLLRPIVSVS